MSTCNASGAVAPEIASSTLLWERPTPCRKLPSFCKTFSFRLSKDTMPDTFHPLEDVATNISTSFANSDCAIASLYFLRHSDNAKQILRRADQSVLMYLGMFRIYCIQSQRVHDVFMMMVQSETAARYGRWRDKTTAFLVAPRPHHTHSAVLKRGLSVSLCISCWPLRFFVKKRTLTNCAKISNLDVRFLETRFIVQNESF